MLYKQLGVLGIKSGCNVKQVNPERPIIKMQNTSKTMKSNATLE